MHSKSLQTGHLTRMIIIRPSRRCLISAISMNKEQVHSLFLLSCSLMVLSVLWVCMTPFVNRDEEVFGAHSPAASASPAAAAAQLDRANTSLTRLELKLTPRFSIKARKQRFGGLAKPRASAARTFPSILSSAFESQLSIADSISDIRL